MANTGIVIPIQSTDAGKAQVKSQLENLGSQMSQLVQSYNDLRNDVDGKANDPAVKAQLTALLDQRKAAIRNLVESFVSAKQQAETQQIAVQSNIPTLSGLGADSLGGLQTAVATEQSKLTALATYYQQAQAAVAAGQPMPPVPAELQTTSSIFGIPTSWLFIGAVIAAVYFMSKD